jgi:hypothetical protein
MHAECPKPKIKIRALVAVNGDPCAWRLEYTQILPAFSATAGLQIRPTDISEASQLLSQQPL